MSIRDLVLISIGELVLAATFALGILVGVALKRKDSQNGNGNEGKDWIGYPRLSRSEDGAE
jgi:hypothetical protein